MFSGIWGAKFRKIFTGFYRLLTTVCGVGVQLRFVARVQRRIGRARKTLACRCREGVVAGGVDPGNRGHRRRLQLCRLDVQDARVALLDPAFHSSPSALHRVERGDQSITLRGLQQVMRRLKRTLSDIFGA